MPIRSWSLTRLLDKGFLHSMDEEDLEALTVAIVLEVASRRQVTLQLQPDAQGNWSYSESSPTLSEAVSEIQDREACDVYDETQMPPARPVGAQEE